MTNPNYLTGKRSTYSNGDRLRQAHLDAYPEERPYLERNGPRLAFLCIVALVALGSVSWGWSKVNQAIAEHVEIEVN